MGTDPAAAARRLHDASRLIHLARAAALASTARLLLHPVDETVSPSAPYELRTAITDSDTYYAKITTLPDPDLDEAHALPIEYKLRECPGPRKVDADTIAAMQPLLPDSRNLDFREIG